jgi:hypothetical protein
LVSVSASGSSYAVSALSMDSRGIGRALARALARCVTQLMG